MIVPLFENIKSKISEFLFKSQKTVKIASAFFSDHELFEILCKLSQKGIQVQLIISDHPSNFLNAKINFRHLIESGGKLYLACRTTSDSFMHHKFCIIDDSVLINGSYNWTIRASTYNLENIVIINDKDCVDSFQKEFSKIILEFSIEQNGWKEYQIFSGFIDLDRISQGFYPGELILIAGRIGMGQEYLAQKIALNNAVDFQNNTYYVSTYQSHSEVFRRFIASRCNVSPKYADFQSIEFQNEANMISKAPLKIEDLSSTINNIEIECQRFSLIGGKLVVINNINEYVDFYRSNTSESINILSRLKSIARKFRLTIFLVADLPTPKGSNRQTAVPNIAELDNFEGFFDSIIFVHNDNYSYDDVDSKSTVKHVYMQKNYLGCVGNAYLSYDPDTNNFFDLIENQHSNSNFTDDNLIKMPSRFKDEEDIPF
ncbi:phospholipase D-like domain-containing protein [Haliscomenobacter sp.]|uniref:phospholipase D-like domain-containing protein n=1 Tax=Haliscomenobacter sp. TaxID=2717303 RepID=UPI003BA953FB